MKKRIVGMAGILLLMAGAAIASAESGTVTVSGGVLSVGAANVTLPGVTLDGTDQTTTSTSNAWTAEDVAGPGPRITTRKDAVKIARLPELPELSEEPWVLDVELGITRGQKVLAALIDALPEGRGRTERAAIHAGLSG